MSKFLSGVFVENDVDGHPAARVWRTLQPDRVPLSGIEILKERKKKPESFKSGVYRLTEATGKTVIAKRCRRSVAELEISIYTNVLSVIPLNALRLFGYAEDLSDDYLWIFLEDAAGYEYDNNNEVHRIISARWLGFMHTQSTDLYNSIKLPDRTPYHYSQIMGDTTDLFHRSTDHPSITRNDKYTIELLLSLYRILETNWELITSLCESWPQTLVHGDFVAKNIRVSTCGTLLYPFDWEQAGVGPLAIDIGSGSNLDHREYWMITRKRWPDLKESDITHMARLGRIFRSLDAIYWIAWSFHYPTIQRRTFDKLAIYKDFLARAIQEEKLNT